MTSSVFLEIVGAQFMSLTNPVIQIKWSQGLLEGSYNVSSKSCYLTLIKSKLAFRLAWT